MNRLRVAAALCMLVGFSLMPSPTRAAVPLNVPVEYCAARIHRWSTFPSRPGLVAYSLDALKERSASGDVLFRTTLGWFSAPFVGATLTPATQTWKTPTLTFERNVFVSGVIYVILPKHAKVLSLWVRDASVSASSDRLTCAGLPQTPDAKQDLSSVTQVNAPVDRVGEVPAPDIKATVAVLTSPPGAAACSQPDSDAVLLHRARFHSTMAASPNTTLVSEVMLAISGNGQPDAVWTYVPSGSSELDAAVIDVAQRSLYRPARAFCQFVPGYYVFKFTLTNAEMP